MKSILCIMLLMVMSGCASSQYRAAYEQGCKDALENVPRIKFTNVEPYCGDLIQRRNAGMLPPRSNQ